jgi:DNA-binding GntR family transcriptional regulator
MLVDIGKDMLSSRREQVANIIRDSILSGLLKPGERIREKELSDQLGVSRGPIREAIRQLVQEGLLISYPYKETVVAEISDEETKDVLIPIRMILETYSVEKACENLTEKDIEQLELYTNNMRQATEKNDLPRLVENNLLFHQYIVSLSKSQSLELIWFSIMNRIRLHFYHLRSEAEVANDIVEHQNIVHALKSRDAKKAIVLLKNHIK